MHRSQLKKLAATLALAGLVSPAAFAQSWEPTKNVEFIVPAGTGGGADQMARLIDGIIKKNKLMKTSITVINKGGGAGAEGFLDVKGTKDPHKIIITLSNLFTTPMAQGTPFSWKDLTPVKMMALDQFVLWVHKDNPAKNAKEYLEQVKSAPADARKKMGGTGSKQEDQIITVAIEKQAGVKFTYIPYKGGGEVATQLVGKHIDSTVNNPIEAVAQWRAGNLKPMCVFDDQRMPYKDKIAGTMSWNDIPTCKESGVDTDYLMLRGIFTVPGASPAVVKYYTELLDKVRATPEWKEFMEKGAFNQTALTGKEFNDWLTKNEKLHYALMKDAGFLAPGK